MLPLPGVSLSGTRKIISDKDCTSLKAKVGSISKGLVVSHVPISRCQFFVAVYQCSPWKSSSRCNCFSSSNVTSGVTSGARNTELE